MIFVVLFFLSSLIQEQCKAVCDVFRVQLPTATLVEPQGGYFLWVKLPDGLSGMRKSECCVNTNYDVFVCVLGSELMKTCEEHFKVTFAPGVVYVPIN